MTRSLILTVLLFLTAGCSVLPNKQSKSMEGYDYAFALRGGGSPLVIFESGLGSDMDDWYSVFESGALLSTVFAYDRRDIGDTKKTGNKHNELVSGLVDAILPGSGAVISAAEMAGNGNSIEAKRDGITIIEELRRLLASLHLSPPYVLVSHSLGGMYAELYARTYPSEIAGLVFIDPRRTNFTRQCKAITKDDACEFPAWLQKILPEPVIAEYKDSVITDTQMQQAGKLPAVPLFVLTATDGPQNFTEAMKRLWRQTHADLVAEVKGAEHILVKDSGHFIHKDNPQLVIGVIQRVISASRQAN